MTTSTVIGQVEPFQLGTEDWEQYTERLKQFFLANGIDDDGKKLAVFLTVVGAKTYALLSNLVAPTKPAEPGGEREYIPVHGRAEEISGPM